MIELVGVLMARPEADEYTFETLLGVLVRLNEADERWSNLLPYFFLQLSAALGFAPIVERENVRRIGSSGGFFSLDNGDVSTAKPHGPSSSASRKAIRAIGVMVHADLDTIMRMDLDRQVSEEVLQLVESYLRFHVEDFRPSRSKPVFDRIL